MYCPSCQACLLASLRNWYRFDMILRATAALQHSHSTGCCTSCLYWSFCLYLNPVLAASKHSMGAAAAQIVQLLINSGTRLQQYTMPKTVSGCTAGVQIYVEAGNVDQSHSGCCHGLRKLWLR